ncbi:MAG: hypothetical protein KBH93_14410, partial [Anaerolineae bacterium]|nr:hypothetical protein [Anaerolineae bacterium]
PGRNRLLDRFSAYRQASASPTPSVSSSRSMGAISARLIDLTPSLAPLGLPPLHAWREGGEARQRRAGVR